MANANPQTFVTFQDLKFSRSGVPAGHPSIQLPGPLQVSRFSSFSTFVIIPNTQDMHTAQPHEPSMQY